VRVSTPDGDRIGRGSADADDRRARPLEVTLTDAARAELDARGAMRARLRITVHRPGGIVDRASRMITLRDG